MEKLGELGVDDYVEIVRATWSDIHGRRTVLDCTLHLLDHASKLGESIRKDDAGIILKETAETTNWLFGLVAKLNDKKEGWESVLDVSTPLSQMIWNKYPNLCPHCFGSAYWREQNRGDSARPTATVAMEIQGKCRFCLTDYPKVEKRSKQEDRTGHLELRKFAGTTNRNIPGSLDRMEQMFHTLYAANTAISTLESIGFHILEETGEVGRAVIDIYTEKPEEKDQLSLVDRRNELGDEIAEVFGWLCSLTLKVRTQAATFDEFQDRLSVLGAVGQGSLAERVGLEKILWITYRDPATRRYRCDYCRHTPCICKVNFAWQ